jgi:hypothetical protein
LGLGLACGHSSKSDQDLELYAKPIRVPSYFEAKPVIIS